MPWFLYAIIAALGISLISIIQKRVLRQEHSLEYALLFSLAKLVVFLPLFWSRVDWSISGSALGWIILSASFGAVSFLLVVKAIKRMEVSSVTPLLALEPGIVAIIAGLTLHEAMKGQALAGLIIVVAGTFLLEIFQQPAGWWHAVHGFWPKIIQPFRTLTQQAGGWYIVIALVAFSISAVMARHVLLTTPMMTYLAYDFIVGASIYITLSTIRRRRIEVFRSGRVHVLFIILFLALLHIGQSAAQATAMALAPVGLVIAMKRTSVLLDVAVGGRLFHEQHLMKKFVATLLMVSGAIMIAVS